MESDILGPDHCLFIYFIVRVCCFDLYMSCSSWSITKPKKLHVRSARNQISLDIYPVWSVSSLCAQRVAKDTHDAQINQSSLCAQRVAKDTGNAQADQSLRRWIYADSEDSDETGRMSRSSLSPCGREGWWDWADAQASWVDALANLNLRWAQKSFLVRDAAPLIRNLRSPRRLWSFI